MNDTFRKEHYPLGIQCGHNLWQQLQLTELFSQAPPPGRTYFLHLITDHLRKQATVAPTAGELELWATLNRVLLQIGRHYLTSRGCRIFRNRVLSAGSQLELPQLETLFSAFLKLFPSVPISLGQSSITLLIEQLEQQDRLDELLLELFLLRVQSQNPALQTAAPLYQREEQLLQQTTQYHQQLQQIDQSMPDIDDGYGQLSGSLLKRLLTPLQSSNSLREQLLLLQQLWSAILPADLLAQITAVISHYEQEGQRPGAPGEAETTTLDPAAYLDEEFANFTIDLDWMPRTVLLAKTIYVWLHQLSDKYSQHIYRLDQIPDAELNEIAASGFNSLWLIGIWQRSRASQKIKQLCGQLQVAASAYAIHDYRIADDLGGATALENLRQRCRERGIDLACDVVTNHTGIDSVWVKEHPDWFIQLSHPPYPGYRYNGPDLSEDADFTVQIDDGYYDHSEAAVTCRYLNHHTGEVRYLYHGNDGTHLPWNDTAQLNYLLPQVRETMIQLILSVAKRFRIIRFDAAMTLAKKHFQRLWYPLPGGGAGVPSRTDHALNQEDFNRFFPIEFWRELVDRVRVEAPDTLLVAEAFWLMEGYFVRTLGMHRVYNSAFMNMLKREENTKYRQTIKNILTFDPAILQRFVNFMSNPDEKPAIEQFGKDDKYFCVATMLATMPGLPMFGHGQIEGFHEKYGMEYLAPHWQEQVDQQLLGRHRRETFPLLRKRALFSGAEDFQLYDFVSDYGIEENIFAYSNRLAQRNVLILCNNSPLQIKGRVGDPSPRSDARQQALAAACNISPQSDFVVLTDLSSGLQHLQPTAAINNGGTFTLSAYCHHVFTDFAAIDDQDGRWQQLWQRYGSSGRRNLWNDYAALPLEPFATACQQLLESVTPAEEMVAFSERTEHIRAELARLQLAGFDPEQLLQISFRSQFPTAEEADFAGLERLGERLITSENLDPKKLYPLFDRLFNRRDWRKLHKCNYYNEVDWLSQDALNSSLSIFFQFLIFTSYKNSSPDIGELLNVIIDLLKNHRTLTAIAAKSDYQVDFFLQLLEGAEPDKPVLPSASGGLPTMKILFVTPEATPFAKTGGLADVAGSLPRALRQLGHDVRVILPGHRSAERSGVSLRKGRKSVEVTLDGIAYRGSLKQASHEGVPYWFIDCPEFFDRDPLYGTAEGDYADNSLRFGFFCRAVLEMIKRLDFRPDVIHINDWQTSFIPALLRTELRHNPFYSSIATLLTIHNLGYQGIFPLAALRPLGLDPSLGSAQGMEYFGNISALKAGINFADVINTVSPTYCLEIQTAEQGHGFDGILQERKEDLHGIINGLDRHSWDPALDTALPTAFNAENLNGKRACKRLLQKEMGLETRHDVPIIALVSRLDRQKGIDLVEKIWPELLTRDIQFVLLGSGSKEDEKFWNAQMKRYPGKVSINIGFDENLSHRVYAASDLLLVPSLYEPCGLTQMISLSYGALPVVRNTGGLADTVLDVTAHPRQGYGFIFENSDPDELLAAIDRALAIYPQRSRWLTLVKRGMSQDFSWAKSAAQYQQLYIKARNYRQMPAA
jgi:ADP-glucose type glycogen/starch synthase